MPVPGFQSFMLPWLQLTKDGRVWSLSEAMSQFSLWFELTEADRAELLPSGRKTTFYDRVGWAATYLRKAGLLESAGRGRYRLSDSGRVVLSAPLERIDISFLMQYPSFADFRTRPRPVDAPVETETQDALLQTPEEALESSYQTVRQKLAEEILERVKTCTPKFFEGLVVDLLVAMGYGGSRKDAGEAIGRSGDGGIDGIIKEDKLGLDAVYIQAKRWDGTVGRPVIQQFAGSLDGVRARKGVFISTSTYTQDARDFVTRIDKRIVLIDGEQLAQFMIDYGIGTAEVARYVIKRIDSDYFEEN